MKYKWALSGIIETPIYVPESHLEIKITGKHHPNKFPDGKIELVGDVVRMPNFDRIYISNARFTVNNKMGSVLFDSEGKYIAAAYWNWVNIIPQYRGMGLAPELIAEDMLRNVDEFLRSGGAPSYIMNKGGAVVVGKAIKLLLEREAFTTHEKE